MCTTVDVVGYLFIKAKSSSCFIKQNGVKERMEVEAYLHLFLNSIPDGTIL